MCKRPPLPSEKEERKNQGESLSPRFFPRAGTPGRGGGEVLLKIIGGDVPPGSPNPDPISDQNMRSRCNFPHPFLDQTSKIRPGLSAFR